MKTRRSIVLFVIVLAILFVSQAFPAAKPKGWVKSYYEIKSGSDKLYPEFHRAIERANRTFVAVGSVERHIKGTTEGDIDGIVLLLKADRQRAGATQNEPPRRMRLGPAAGPTGSVWSPLVYLPWRSAHHSHTLPCMS